MDENGDIYVTGYETAEAGNKDIVIIKYNSNLDTQWVYHYDRNGNDDIASAMALDHSGHVVVTGYSGQPNNPSSEDMITIKVDCQTGDSVWVRSYNGEGELSDKAYAIIVDDQDNVIITGYSSVSALDSKITTIRYSSGGARIWEKFYDPKSGSANSIALTSDSKVIITGYVGSEADADYVTIGYENDTTGTQLWDKTYNGTGDNTDIAYSLVVSPIDNSVYVTGSSKNSTEEGTEDMVTFKYDASTGDKIDSSIYNDISNGEDVAYDIALDSLGNVYVTGYVAPGGDIPTRTSEIMTLKYTSGHLVSRNSNVIPGSFKLSQNYPNPFNPSTTINFQIPSPGVAKIVVYDILGRQVDILVNQFMKSGDYSVKFDGSRLASGIYFTELTFGSLKDVKKMVLIK